MWWDTANTTSPGTRCSLHWMEKLPERRIHEPVISSVLRGHPHVKSLQICQSRTHTLALYSRSPERIPSHWATLAHGRQSNSQALSHAHLRTECRRCQVPLLVFPYEAAQGQEGQWRGCIPKYHQRKAAIEGENFRHLDPVRLEIRRAQYVQGIPRDEPDRCS